MYNPDCELHQYYLSSNVEDLKSRYYVTRKAAEAALNGYCSSHGLVANCIECSKHERLYEAGGNTFCINRI